MLDTTLPKLSRPEVAAGRSGALLGTEVFHPALQPPRPPRALLDIMLRVQEFVLQRRIRVSEYFRVNIFLGMFICCLIDAKLNIRFFKKLLHSLVLFVGRTLTR